MTGIDLTNNSTTFAALASGGSGGSIASDACTKCIDGPSKPPLHNVIIDSSLNEQTLTDYQNQLDVYICCCYSAS